MSVAETAKRYGWELLFQWDVEGDGIQASGSIARLKTKHPDIPYIVAFYNRERGDFFCYEYCRTFASSEVTFMLKCERYKRHTDENTTPVFAASSDAAKIIHEREKREER